jgi:hypothetical protein
MGIRGHLGLIIVISRFVVDERRLAGLRWVGLVIGRSIDVSINLVQDVIICFELDVALGLGRGVPFGFVLNVVGMIFIACPRTGLIGCWQFISLG